MKQLRLPIFTSQIKFYNLRIVPPEPVFDGVMEIKKQFQDSYGKQPLSKAKPHITIANFKMNAKYQDMLIRIFEGLSNMEKFELAIEGFGEFNNSNTLYLKVAEKEAMSELHKAVEDLRNEYLKRKLKLFLISDNPHMTISITTGKTMLYDSLHHFRENDYFGQFEVGHLTLVSRSKYKSWDWQHQIMLS